MSQPTTQTEVLTDVLITFHRWPIWEQMKRAALARIAFRRIGVTLHKNGGYPNLPTITAAWYGEKTRLGRTLTSTELNDILGWAA